MDLMKIGRFLQDLRKEKGMTQEELAEQLNVARRTVSRWETGNNMPDMDILIELSELYDVDLREILDGERKNGKMNEEVKETVLKATEYTNAEMERYNRRTNAVMTAGVILWFVSALIKHTSLVNERTWSIFSELAEGAGMGIVISRLIFVRKYNDRLCAFKQRLVERFGR